MAVRGTWKEISSIEHTLVVSLCDKIRIFGWFFNEYVISINGCFFFLVKTRIINRPK
jgi:hypothetical protein